MKQGSAARAGSHKAQRVTNVLIADDNPMSRLGLRHVLQEIPGLKVVAEAGTSDEVMSALSNGEIDFLILEPILSDNPSETIKAVRTKRPDIRVFVYSRADGNLGVNALKQGASGYLMKKGSDRWGIGVKSQKSKSNLFSAPALIFTRSHGKAFASAA